jgi:hypothetical protein
MSSIIARLRTGNGIATFAATCCLIFFSLVFVMPAHATDPIGTATQMSMTCPPGGVGSGTCFRVTINGCAGGTFYAGAKLNTSTNGTPIGAVILTTGGGDSYYDTTTQFKVSGQCGGTCGEQTVLDLNAAGYNTIQTNFEDPDTDTSIAGWLTGSTTSIIGPRLLACRYATFVNWAWTFLLKSDTSRPVCATGNSAGSAALAFALSQYELGSSSGPGPVLTLAEVTSGPPLSSLQHACLSMSKAPTVTATCPSGTPINESIGLSDAGQFVDPSFDGESDCVGTVCTPDSTDTCGITIKNNVTAPAVLHHDSILSDTDPPLTSFNTTVRQLFGADDGSASVPLGMEWYNVITSTKSQVCVPNAQHALPGYTTGEAQIVTDIKNMCVK